MNPLVLFLIQFAAGAYMSAALTYFIDFCVEKPSRIGGRWKFFLAINNLRRHNKTAYKSLVDQYARQLETAKTNGGSFRQIKYIFMTQVIDTASSTVYWEKPLGYCPVCMNPYLSVGIFFLFNLQSYFAWGWQFYLLPVGFILAANHFLRKML